MNRNSIQEYILWLEKFGVIYKEYIDSSKELNEIFAGTLEKFKKILKGNFVNTEENIIRSLKELVRKFSVAYNANRSKNKSMRGPRNTHVFKQNIYNTEIAELKEFLIKNLDTELFSNFESIVMYVAKKRQMIEFLKLGKVIDVDYPINISHAIYFEVFVKRRITGFKLISYLYNCHAKHLYDEKSRLIPRQITYTYKGKKINLTFYYNSIWNHTNDEKIPQLFQIMNELYSQFLTLVNRRNSVSKRDILSELYWLYMQTCPFEKGSAAIGEILFSVLLRKYFGCDFLISKGWNENPLTIPDIHALHYELDHFKSIFWDQLTNCTGKAKDHNFNILKSHSSN